MGTRTIPIITDGHQKRQEQQQKPSTRLERLCNKLLASAAAAQHEDADGRIKAVRTTTAPPPKLDTSTPAGMIAELKSYLEAVVAADAAGDPLLSSITQQHAVVCAVRAICEVEDGSLPMGKVGGGGMILLGLGYRSAGIAQ
jgi:hypothetical protein